MEHRNGEAPPVFRALSQRHRAAGREDPPREQVTDGRMGKPPETAGRKVMGTKAGMLCQPGC